MGTKKRIQYRYTVTGQRSLLIDPDGGRFTYTYDSLKRLTQVHNPQAQRTTFAYDNAGRRTVKKLANGSRTSFTYDLANRLTTVAQLKSDASVQARYDYKYDKAGNRTEMAESGVMTARTTWTYDAAYQLTGENRTGSNAFRHTYTYDNRGNRTLKNLDGTRTTSAYDDANQLRYTQDAGGRTTYTFDADGNQQVVLTPAGQRTTSVWDYENKLTGVLNPSGTRETMAYDPDGKRVKHQTASETAKYVWDQENYLQEADASNVTQATYTNEPRTYGSLISQRKSSATHYYVFDALGSTRLLTDSAEAVSESLLYDAWGNLLTAAPTLAVPFRWVGELGYLFVPSTSDYYVRARIFGPTIGRWISRDPLGFVDGLNLYTYVLNYTSSIVDASGNGLITDLEFPEYRWTPVPPPPGSAEFDEALRAIGALLGTAVSPTARQRFHTYVVVKSFIVGPIVPGTIDRRGGWGPAIDLAASRRLWWLASRVGRLPAFNQNPPTDVMDGEYRLFTMANVTYACDCDDRPRDLEWSKGDDGGLEIEQGQILPLHPPANIYGLMFSNIQLERSSFTCLRLSIEGWGRPNPLVEPGMQWVAPRTSTDIWHRAVVEICCVNGKGEHSLVEFTGSKFPTHRIWINGTPIKTLPQGTYGDLWDGDPRNTRFVEEGSWP